MHMIDCRYSFGISDSFVYHSAFSQHSTNFQRNRQQSLFTVAFIQFSLHLETTQIPIHPLWLQRQALISEMCQTPSRPLSNPSF